MSFKFLFFFGLTFSVVAAPQPPLLPIKNLDHFQKEILAQGSKSVPQLVSILKNKNYSVHTRWVSTFLLAQLMGDKAGPFIAEFAQDKSWIIRTAVLKSFLALGQKDQRAIEMYKKLLQDESLIVRTQALDNIRTLKLESLGAEVLKMLYDERNYQRQANRPLNLLRMAIKVLGELQYKGSHLALTEISQQKGFQPFRSDIETTLKKVL